MIIPGLFHGCYHYILPPPNARSASSGKSSSCRRHRRHTRTRIRTPETNSGHDCRNAERATVASSKRPRRFREAGRVARPASRPGQPPFPGANSWCFQGSIRDPRGAPAPARTPGQSPSSQRPQLVRRELRDYERAPQEAPRLPPAARAKPRLCRHHAGPVPPSPRLTTQAGNHTSPSTMPLGWDACSRWAAGFVALARSSVTRYVRPFSSQNAAGCRQFSYLGSC